MKEIQIKINKCIDCVHLNGRHICSRLSQALPHDPYAGIFKWCPILLEQENTPLIIYKKLIGKLYIGKIFNPKGPIMK